MAHEIRTTAEFDRWFNRLRDTRAQDRIALRLRTVERGSLGDAKFFGGIGELRVNYGPGYRLYFRKQGETIIVLLCGGDKKTQDADIARAMALAKEL